MEKEIWKDIENHPNYKISSYGNIKNIKTNKLLKPFEDRGYLKVRLNNKPYRVHRLVATAFIENPNNYPQINHINEQRNDNRVENLEWCDNKYNSTYGNKLNRQINTNIKNNKLGVPLIQFTLNGEIVNFHQSSRNVERELGFTNDLVCNCCKGKHKQSYGYKWKHVYQWLYENNKQEFENYGEDMQKVIGKMFYKTYTEQQN